MGGRVRCSGATQRGSVLIEALITGSFLAIGLLGLARWQLALRGDGELAAQRSTAVRIAEAELESIRATAGASAASSVPGTAAVGPAPTAATGTGRPIAWRVDRRLDTTPVAETQEATVDVGWSDPAGRPQHVVVRTIVGASDAALGGVLAMQAAAGGLSSGKLRGRAASIPVMAIDRGDGTSLLHPSPAGNLGFVFDNPSGRIVRLCDPPTSGSAAPDPTFVGPCRAVSALRLGGIVRFALGPAPDVARADDPPLAFAIGLTLSGSGYPHAPSCGVQTMKSVSWRDEAGVERRATVGADSLPADVGAASWVDTGERFASYECAIETRADGRWSGRVRLLPTGWSIGSSARSYRICRYVADLDGDASTDTNAEHPAEYTAVDAPLANQNLLVIRGDRSCPAPATVALQP